MTSPAGMDCAPDLRALLAALVDPLMDARSRPAGDQFDRLVAAAVADGRIEEELARQLRFWQRASVLEVTDHVRTVLPAVLPAALTAATTSMTEAAAAAAGAAAAWQAREAQPSTDVHPVGTAPAAGESIQVVLSAAEEIGLEPAPSADEPTAPPAIDQQLRRRLFVAGLTSTA